MNTSEKLDAIATALSKAQAEFPKIEKGRKAKIPTKNGGNYEYSYADIADVLSAVLPVLAKHELALVQPTSVEGNVILIRSRLLHGSGQWIESVYPVCSLNGDHKAMGSAMTYARRYAACSLLGVVADEDIDGEGAADPAPPQRRNGNGQRQAETSDAEAYVGNARATIESMTTDQALTTWWRNEGDKRRSVGLTQTQVDDLKRLLIQRREALSPHAGAQA